MWPPSIHIMDGLRGCHLIICITQHSGTAGGRTAVANVGIACYAANLTLVIHTAISRHLGSRRNEALRKFVFAPMNVYKNLIVLIIF